MRIIDFHTHAFPDKIAQKAIKSLENGANEKAFGNGTVSSLLEYMGKSNIEHAVLSSIATKPEQLDNIISWSLELKNKNIPITPFASFYPDENYRESIDKIAIFGFCGIKLHPYYQNFSVDEERMKPIYEYICSKRMILLFHAGYDIAFEKKDIASPKKFRTIIELFPELDVIASHMGGWCAWDEVLEHLVGTTIIFDTAYLRGHIAPGILDKILKVHNTSKILFGTDFPWSNPADDIKQIMSWKISDLNKRKFFFDNAERLFNQHGVFL